jgi:hypothetical protein
MTQHMKYVVIEGFGDEIYIFSPLVKHSQFVDMMGGLRCNNVLGAGFIDENWNCYGESVTLDIKSRGIVDTNLVRMWQFSDAA